MPTTEKVILIAIIMAIALSSCTSIGSKSWGIASSSDALDLESSIDPKTMTATPKGTAGGNTTVALFALPRKEKERYPTMFGYSSRQSFWGLFGSTGAGNKSFIYISGSSETPEQTVSILDRISKMMGAEK